MGFTPKPKRTARLSFSGDNEGAEVLCSLGTSVGFYLELLAGKTDLADQGHMLRRFGDELLLEWNLEDRQGNPLPANGDGMCSVDLSFATDVLGAWLEAMGTSAPLDSVSPSGDTSEPPTTPTETATPSPRNSRRQR